MQKVKEKEERESKEQQERDEREERRKMKEMKKVKEKEEIYEWSMKLAENLTQELKQQTGKTKKMKKVEVESSINMMAKNCVLQIDCGLSVCQSVKVDNVEAIQRLDIVQTVCRSKVIYENNELRNVRFNEKDYAFTDHTKPNILIHRSI